MAHAVIFSIVEKLVSLGYEESDMPDNPKWANLVEQTKELTERSTSISLSSCYSR